MTKGVTAPGAGIIGAPAFDVVGNGSSCQGPNDKGLRPWDEDEGVENVGVDKSVGVDENIGVDENVGVDKSGGVDKSAEDDRR